MERVATFSDRLKQYRQMKGLTLSELASKTGIFPQTLNRYELDQRIPKIDIANEIADKLNINTLWLQGYDVPIYNEPELTDTEKELQKVKNRPEYKILFKSAANATPEDIIKAAGYIDSLIASAHPEENTNQDIYDDDYSQINDKD